MLKQGADVTFCSDDGVSVVAMAQIFRPDLLAWMVKQQHVKNLQTVTPHNGTLLHSISSTLRVLRARQAPGKGAYDGSAVSLAKSVGVDINARDSLGRTAAFLACAHGAIIFSSSLFNNGADFSILDDRGVDGWTATLRTLVPTSASDDPTVIPEHAWAYVEPFNFREIFQHVTQSYPSLVPKVLASFLKHMMNTDNNYVWLVAQQQVLLLVGMLDGKALDETLWQEFSFGAIAVVATYCADHNKYSRAWEKWNVSSR
jgi:hypothetical protein